MSKFKLQRKVKIKWSPDFAYAIGLIVSDGSLSKDGRHIQFSSKERELISNFKKSLSLKNKVTRHARGGEKDKKYLQITFGDKVFYKYLNSIGITQAKSKIIKHVQIPKKYFPDFLRGLFDGDGSFYTYWDKRWPNSFGFKLSFASASLNFISWLKEKIAKLYNINGYFHKGAGVISLEYVKGSSKKLFFLMYHSDNILFLKRKYIKIKLAIKKDKGLGLIYLQKPRGRVSSAARALP